MEIRTFGAGDEEAIVQLWNRRVSGCYATGPIDAARFAEDVAGKTYFDPEGLVLAFDAGRPVALAHAGFKSADCIHPDMRAGTIGMAAVEEGQLDAGRACMDRAIRYLIGRGAKMVEAFEIDFPNTPFYNGLYGGEKAGMDESHPLGLELMRACSFNVSIGTVIMMCDLNAQPPAPALPPGYSIRVTDWDGPAKGMGPKESYGIPERIRQADLIDAAGAVVGYMHFWHLDRYNKAAGDRLAVVSHVWVSEKLQGSGVAAPLQCRVHDILKSEGATRMGLGTGGRNIRAISFYRKVGYQIHKAAYLFHLDWRELDRYRDTQRRQP